MDPKVQEADKDIEEQKSSMQQADEDAVWGGPSFRVQAIENGNRAVQVNIVFDSVT